MATKRELEERVATKGSLEIVRGFCCQCTNGPHPINCHVVNGILTKIEPNRELGPYIYCPEGRPACAKPNSFIQKVYNPHRVKTPMKRTNPKKGRGIDPGWQEISWEEAFDIVASKLLEIKEKGMRDENNYPRVGLFGGSDGLSAILGGTLFALLMALGAVDASFYSGGSARCYHTEHYYGELWHRAFICMPDPDRVKWLLSCGRNDYSNWMSTGQTLMDRRKDFKRTQIDPHLTVTGAMSDEWIPIKPLTDYALLLAMAHVILHEMDWHKVCDIDFLKNMTGSPYLIGPHGYYVRDPETHKPLIWDPVDAKAKHIDANDIKGFALEGKYKLKAIEIGPDEETWEIDEATVSFELLLESIKDFTPEWASEICDVSAHTIRRLAKEYVDNAMVGATIEMEGRTFPYRPVFIGMTKNNSNGPGSYLVELVVHILSCLVGALEVPGGHLSGIAFTAPGPVERDDDGFLDWPFLPTDKEKWPWPPGSRCWVESLCPIIGTSPMRDALGPNHLTWIGVDEGTLPGDFPVKPPDMFVSFKCNPPITVQDSDRVERVLAKMPFHVRIAYEFDETTAFADILMPENIDVEATQIWLTGSMACYGQALTDHLLVMGRFPAVKPYNTMDITDICYELADRVGILDTFNEILNDGFLTHSVTFKEPYRLEPGKKYTTEEVFEAAARALTNGEHGLDDFRETGGYALPYSRLEGVLLDGRPWGWIRPWYLYSYMQQGKARFEFPYQGRVKKVYEQLSRRLHEKGIYWWDKQLEEFSPLPIWYDIAEVYETGSEYDLWATTGHSGKFQFSYVANPMYLELVEQRLEHLRVQINSETAKQRGIKDEDEIWVESAYSRVKGRAKLREGLRPDTIVLHGTFGHWATPLAKDYGEKLPNINRLSKMDLNTMAEDGGVRDTVKVKVYKATE